MFRYIPAEIVGFVHGYALDPGEIKANEDVMQEAYDLGRKLASG